MLQKKVNLLLVFEFGLEFVKIFKKYEALCDFLFDFHHLPSSAATRDGDRCAGI